VGRKEQCQKLARPTDGKSRVGFPYYEKARGWGKEEDSRPCRRQKGKKKKENLNKTVGGKKRRSKKKKRKGGHALMIEKKRNVGNDPLLNSAPKETQNYNTPPTRKNGRLVKRWGAGFLSSKRKKKPKEGQNTLETLPKRDHDLGGKNQKPSFKSESNRKKLKPDWKKNRVHKREYK